jgi:hypothetical protein
VGLCRACALWLQVLGFHYIGPHAGEITQGFALVEVSDNLPHPIPLSAAGGARGCAQGGLRFARWHPPNLGGGVHVTVHNPGERRGLHEERWLLRLSLLRWKVGGAAHMLSCATLTTSVSSAWSVGRAGSVRPNTLLRNHRSSQQALIRQ